MEFISIYIIVILLFSIAKGYHYRFNLEFAGFIGILLGVMIASNGNDYFGDFLNSVSSIEDNKDEFTFSLSFAISVLGTWITTLFLAKFANKATVHHAMTDSILGGFTALLKSIVIISYLLASSYRIDYVEKNYKKMIDKSSISLAFLDFGRKILMNGNKRVEMNIRRVTKYMLSSVDKNYILDTNKTSKTTINSIDDIHGQETVDALGKRIEKNYYQSLKYTKGYKEEAKSDYKEIKSDYKTKEKEINNIKEKEIIKKRVVPIQKETRNIEEKIEYLDDKFLDEIYQDTIEDVKSLDDLD
jgi:uncharacterized membrane protein required for colicin V production